MTSLVQTASAAPLAPPLVRTQSAKPVLLNSRPDSSEFAQTVPSNPDLTRERKGSLRERDKVGCCSSVCAPCKTEATSPSPKHTLAPGAHGSVHRTFLSLLHLFVVRLCLR
jgi:hypothetical protein